MDRIASYKWCTNNERPGGRWPGDRHDKSSAAMAARSGGEQQELARRMGPRWAGRSAGAVEDAGDGAWVGHNIEDVHAAAALAADGDGDGEDTGEQVGPADAARSGGGLVGGGPRVVIVEAAGALLAGGGDDRRREDARAEVMAAGEHAEVPCHVEAYSPSSRAARILRPVVDVVLAMSLTMAPWHRLTTDLDPATEPRAPGHGAPRCNWPCGQSNDMH